MLVGATDTQTFPYAKLLIHFVNVKRGQNSYKDWFLVFYKVMLAVHFHYDNSMNIYDIYWNFSGYIGKNHISM